MIMDANTQTACAVLPPELIAEILSFLSVKYLLQFRCVCKSWKSLISDPIFIKIHLHKSARNPRITLLTEREMYTMLIHDEVKDYRLLPSPPTRPMFLSQPTATSNKQGLSVVGSCNGLLCLLDDSFTIDDGEISLCLWNPSTRTKSEKVGFFGYYGDLPFTRYGEPRYCLYFCGIQLRSFKFSFGYDMSTGIYKIVAFHPEKNEVRVFDFGGKGWRYIQSFPVVPLHHTLDDLFFRPGLNDGVYLSGTINWLAIRNKFTYDCHDITVQQFVIISLDLGTETFREMLPPQGFDEVPRREPCVSVLMDCLCFSHDFKETHFLIWRMTEFGVEDSWTQFLKISYHDFRLSLHDFNEDQRSYMFMHPLRLSNNGNTLLLAVNLLDGSVLYNLKKNTITRVRADYDKIWWFSAKAYVESLAST